MSNAAERGKAEAIVREQTGEVDLLSKILEEGRLVQHESQAQQAKRHDRRVRPAGDAGPDGHGAATSSRRSRRASPRSTASCRRS